MTDMYSAKPAPRLLFLSGALMLSAVGTGALVCAINDVPPALWSRNLAAWLIGLLAAGLLQTQGSRWLSIWIPLAALLLAGTFLGPGQSGVHRWFAVGPLSVNAAMLLLPVAVVSLSALEKISPWVWVITLIAMALLVAQPDRSQASAFGIALVWTALTGSGSLPGKLALVLSTVLMIAASWLRADPLEPVPAVEGILQLALASSPMLASVVVASLLGVVLLPVWASWGVSTAYRRVGVALTLYFLVTVIMSVIGAYPVPLVGLGVSPIVGAWLAIGALSVGAKIQPGDTTPKIRTITDRHGA